MKNRKIGRDGYLSAGIPVAELATLLTSVFIIWLKNKHKQWNHALRV